MHPKKGNTMAKFVINVGKLSHTGTDTNTEVEGLVFEIECAPDEIPATIKAAMPLANMMREMTKENNAKALSDMCDQANRADEKRREAEAKLNGCEAKLEAAERRLQRKQDEVEELRKKLFGTPAEK